MLLFRMIFYKDNFVLKKLRNYLKDEVQTRFVFTYFGLPERLL